mmetsp:Transcript_8728/g.9920  ORF Transcript_8728/g.9920 Transcript_8728/m.9920 type:complete len:93 (+) Transcript_8728:543-821(+)
MMCNIESATVKKIRDAFVEEFQDVTENAEESKEEINNQEQAKCEDETGAADGGEESKGNIESQLDHLEIKAEEKPEANEEQSVNNQDEERGN